MNPPIDPLLLNIRDAAKSLSISDRKLWSLTQAGEVPHVRIGRRVMYRPESLRQWLASREQRGAAARRTARSTSASRLS